MSIHDIINYFKKKPFLTAWLINSLLFAALLLFGYPVYHSGDELNILHTLARGYGEPNSHCLPYLYVMHYFFNIPLKHLFIQFPAVNWFSLLMFLAQYISGIALCYVLLCRKKMAVAILIFLAGFIVYGVWMLLYLNISSTSVVCTIAGLVLIWHFYQQQITKPFILIAGILIILTGAFIRMHTLAPVLAVAAPFFLLLPGIRKKTGAFISIAVTLLLIIFLYKIQYQHYSTHCPDWAAEEQYRQAKYNYINYNRDTSNPELNPYQVETAMAEELLFFDTTAPDVKTLNTIAYTARAGMPAEVFFSVSTWYWHFINNRVFLLAFIVLLIVFSFRKKEMFSILASILIGTASAGYLLMYRKLPEFIIPGILFTVFYFAALAGEYKVPANRYKKWGSWLLIALPLLWGLTRVYKINQHNATSFQQFTEMHHELASHPGKLFISTGDGDLFSYYYCFATPVTYPFNNILFIDHPVTSRMPYLESKFGIEDIRKAPLHENVYFRGPEIPVLLTYYQNVLHRSVHYTGTIPGFQHSSVRKITVY